MIVTIRKAILTALLVLLASALSEHYLRGGVAAKAPGAADRSFHFSSGAQLQSLMDRYLGYDSNADGTPEINSLSYLSFEDANEATSPDANLVVVLVEPRLLQNLPAGQPAAADLLARLKRFKDDLRADGYYPRFISAGVYSGAKHQDGRTALAIRSFFKDVKDTYPNFKGAILVGSFPEAMIVRKIIWRKIVEELVIRSGRSGNLIYYNVDCLVIAPEIIADRTDLVLADLDGNWHNLYHEGPEHLELIMAIPDASMGNDWPKDKSYFVSPNDKFVRKSVGAGTEFRDFFWINDSNYSIDTRYTNGLLLYLNTNHINTEMTLADKGLPNPLARPEIFVSRINARHIAINPDPAFRDDYGFGFLDSNLKPQRVESSGGIDLAKGLWRRDPGLERRILIDYFDRNHTFRTGGYSTLPFRAAAIAYDFDVDYLGGYLNAASDAFGSGVIKENASLIDYVNWLKEPAILRGIIAHSGPWGSGFGGGFDVSKLEEATGGRPWRWKQYGTTYKPTLLDNGGGADWYVYRTLWENGILSDAGANLFIHIGCQVNSPNGANAVPYNDDVYGAAQNAESILFYLNGLAIFSRAKVFNDTPNGFTDALAAAGYGNFGEAWKATFNNDSQIPGIPDKAAASKRTYHWSILGDPTLKLRYPGSCSQASIITQPTDQTVCEGSAVSFFVRAAGSNLTYQWYKENTPIAGETRSSLIIPSAGAGDAARYRVVVGSSCSTTGNIPPAYSQPATLKVNRQPTITGQPTNVTACANQPVTFSVTAGGGNLHYQWLKNGSPLSGQNGSSLTIPSVKSGDAGSYNVIVSNSCGSAVPSAAANLTVNGAISITDDPDSVGSCVGKPVTFSVTATGANPRYQWRKDGGNISGATGSSHTIPSLSLSDIGTYTVVVYNGCNSVTSANAILGINNPINITDQPDNATRCLGQAVTFSVTATGTNLRYLWRKNGGNISGAESSSYTIPAVSAADAASYTVVVYNGCSMVNSEPAKLTVSAATLSISPASQSFTAGGGNGSVAVSSTGCGWTAVSNAAWIKVTGGAGGGTANGTVTYSVEANPGAARSGSINIGGRTFTVTQSAGNDAKFITHTVPATMKVGQQRDILVRFQNTGTTTWLSANGHWLSSQNPALNYTWGLRNVGIANPVPPNSVRDFNFTITAPSTPGAYIFQWQLRQGDGGWFGQLMPAVSVTVTP